MYLSEAEKTAKNIIDSNISHFNRNKRKNKLAVKYYISDGNKADILKDSKIILSCVSLQVACMAVAAINNYMEV